ncbi:methyl-accepting chemotaxis protein [Ferrimonas marina]|uniref:Methyl-accepting chemotaxis protein n=1 Tax=Ferrimonas marina TaxID=299255 RepID=A0A1M5XYT7_9GAMM|nr:methyl-accepting chemotaxis protein [Ferrimonas marina]
MSFFARKLASLTLVQRLSISMATLFTIALGLVLSALWGLNALSTTVDQLGEEALPIAHQAGEIERAVLQLDQSLRNAIGSGNHTDFDQRRQPYQQAQQQLQTALARLEQSATQYPHDWLTQGFEAISADSHKVMAQMDVIMAQTEQRLTIEQTLNEGRGYLLFSVNSVRNEMARLYPLLFEQIPGANDAYDSFISGAGGLVGALIQLSTATTPEQAQAQYREVRAYVSRMRFQYDSLADLNSELNEFPSAVSALEVLEQAASRDGLFSQEVERVTLSYQSQQALTELLPQLAQLGALSEDLLYRSNALVEQGQVDTQTTLEQSRQLLLILTALGALLTAWLVQRIVVLLRHSLAELKSAIKATAAGNFTHVCRVDSPAEFNQLAKWLNQANSRNRDVMSRLRRGGEELSQAAGASSRISHQQQQSLAAQAAQTTQIAAAVAELDASMQGIAEATTLTLEDSRRSAELAQQGQQALDATGQHLDALSRHLGDNDGRMAELDEQVDQIGAIAEVINNIADRTNLLALNAAIEAARAGEQGRGFAVVADEVRKLAAQTREQTDSIEAMIQTLHSAAANARDSIQASRDEMSRTEQLRQQLDSATEQIHQAVVMVQSRADSISAATTEQTEQCHQINAGIRQLAEQAESRQGQIDDLSVQSDQVAGIAREQQEKLAQFQV